MSDKFFVTTHDSIGRAYATEVALASDYDKLERELARYQQAEKALPEEPQRCVPDPASFGGMRSCADLELSRGWMLAAHYDALRAYAVKMTAERDEALHESAPSGHKCSDCQINGEPCPVCYRVWWQKKHPNTNIICADDSAVFAATQRAVSAEAELAAARQDAERYRARRYCEWSEYDEYCDSVMPRDGSATRENFAQFHKGYDEDSDDMVADCRDIFSMEQANVPPKLLTKEPDMHPNPIIELCCAEIQKVIGGISASLAIRALRAIPQSEIDKAAGEAVYVIFDGPPGNDAGRFVEVETQDGRGVSIGAWEPYGNYWRLGPLYAAPTAQQDKAGEAVLPKPDYWLIFFDDADRKPEIFNDEAAARARYAQISISWNAHLFAKVDSNSRDYAALPRCRTGM